MEFAELHLKWDRTESRELLRLSRLPFTHILKNESPKKKYHKVVFDPLSSGYQAVHQGYTVCNLTVKEQLFPRKTYLVRYSSIKKGP